MTNTMPNSTFANDFTTACPVLTVSEVARELRCSKAHVHHLIAGAVRGVRPLPSLWLGRRRLILRTSLDAWVQANENRGKAML